MVSECDRSLHLVRLQAVLEILPGTLSRADAGRRARLRCA
jgi:hypothetical protein